MELSLTARPTRAFLVSGAFAYQDARLSEAQPELGALTAGERLPNVPRWTGAVNADYTVMGAGSPRFGITVRYNGDRKASFDAATQFLQYALPSYTTFDLRTGLTLGSVDAQLHVYNVADKRGQVSADASLGVPQVTILQPRTVGLSVSTRF
jgi:outer membrane receptor for monomeric catechols